MECGRRLLPEDLLFALSIVGDLAREIRAGWRRLLWREGEVVLLRVAGDLGRCLRMLWFWAVEGGLSRILERWIGGGCRAQGWRVVLGNAVERLVQETRRVSGQVAVAFSHN